MKKRATLAPVEIENWRKRIDVMEHEEMAKLWRFAKPGHPCFDNRYSELHERFAKRFKEFGGFNPTLSKKIGWENPGGVE